MSQPRLLIVNPNTSIDVTAAILAMAHGVAGTEADIVATTARFGAAYITSRVSAVIAGHALLDAVAGWEAANGAADAIVVGCFGDPGLDALREMTGRPVTGFAEAGFRATIAADGPVLVVTRGHGWGGMLAEIAAKTGAAGRLAGIRTFDDHLTPKEMAPLIAAAVRETDAAHLIVGGAGLIPSLPVLTADCGVPVIDPHAAAIRDAVAWATNGVPLPAEPAGRKVATGGLSPELAAAVAP